MLSILFIFACVWLCVARKQKAWSDQSQSLGCPIQKTKKSLDSYLAHALNRAVDKSTALNIPTLLFKSEPRRMASSLAYVELTPYKPPFLPFLTRCVKRQRMPGLQAECSKRSTSIQIYAGEIHSFSFENLMRKDSFVKWRNKNNIA